MFALGKFIEFFLPVQRTAARPVCTNGTKARIGAPISTVAPALANLMDGTRSSRVRSGQRGAERVGFAHERIEQRMVICDFGVHLLCL